MPIWVSLGLSVFDLGPMYATDRRRTDDHILQCCEITEIQVTEVHI